MQKNYAIDSSEYYAMVITPMYMCLVKKLTVLLRDITIILICKVLTK